MSSVEEISLKKNNKIDGEGGEKTRKWFYFIIIQKKKKQSLNVQFNCNEEIEFKAFDSRELLI